MKYIWLAIISLFLISCAQVVAPSGGAKDTSPPKATKYTPDSASVAFKAKTVNVFFNEYIQLKDVNNQLIISPPLEKKPDIKVKGKILKIEFQSPLKENTTYSLNFGNSIRDITEDNPLTNFQYLFSTGNFIDSLIVKGSVHRAFDNKNENGILVMLYEDISDSAPYKKTPDYFSKTSDNGSYKITNIRSGQYKAFALKDANSNYLYDTPEEFIGFTDNTITVKGIDTLNFSLFKEGITKQYLKKSYTPEYGKITFVFNKSAEDIHINLMNFSGKKAWEIIEYSLNKDTMNYWFTDLDVDTLKLVVSNDNIILDTVELKLITREQAINAKKGTKLKLNIKTNISPGQLLNLNTGISVLLSHPMKEYDFSKISLRNSTGILKPNIIYDDPALRKLQINYPFIEDSTYHLFIPPGTFKDIFDLTNDTLKLDFTMQSLSHYGTLKLKVNVPENGTSYIVQLMDDKENIIKQQSIHETGTINYDFLEPGQFKVKIIADANSNSKWDNGNYLKKQHAERVSWYPSAITVRSNWDMELEWKVEFNTSLSNK